MTDLGPSDASAQTENGATENKAAGDKELATKQTDKTETGKTETDTAASAPASAELAPTPLEVLALSPEEWRIVAVAAVEMHLPGANPEVVLHEAQDPWRELRIPVGLAEGTAIAYAFRGIDTPRPLTHEMVTEVLDRHDVSIAAVRITVRRGQLFFAEIDTMGPRGRRVVPCRPSDAIALALRQRLPTPILVAEWVFTGADAPPGIVDTDVTVDAPTDATTGGKQA